MSGEFVAYRGPEAIHDAVVDEVTRAGDEIIVTLVTVDGTRLVIRFVGARPLTESDPRGMALYSVSEMTSSSPGRRHFHLVNWDDEEPNWEVDAASVEFAVSPT